MKKRGVVLLILIFICACGCGPKSDKAIKFEKAERLDMELGQMAGTADIIVSFHKKPITEKADALNAAEAIIEEYLKIYKNFSYDTISIVQYSEDNMWLFSYYTSDVVGGGLCAAVDGNDARVLKIWMEE